jgi:hypothetical protein
MTVSSAATAFAEVPMPDTAAIDRRIEAFQPSADERRIDEIGWARTLREARQLAGENRRPVFLFTHDGRMAQGRC